MAGGQVEFIMRLGENLEVSPPRLQEIKPGPVLDGTTRALHVPSADVEFGQGCCRITRNHRRRIAAKEALLVA